jgi:type IV pilus assembly protein PilA
MNTRNEKGFTLIELMIVIAIIGILAAIAIPQFNAYRARSYNAGALSDLRNIETAVEAYYVDFQKYPTGITPTAGGTVLSTNYGYTKTNGVSGGAITGGASAYTIANVYNTLAAASSQNSYSLVSDGTGIKTTTK